MGTYSKRGRSFKSQGTQINKPQITVTPSKNIDFKQVEEEVIEYASFESKHLLSYESKSIDKETFRGSFPDLFSKNQVLRTTLEYWYPDDIVRNNEFILDFIDRMEKSEYLTNHEINEFFYIFSQWGANKNHALYIFRNLKDYGGMEFHEYNNNPDEYIGEIKTWTPEELEDPENQLEKLIQDEKIRKKSLPYSEFSEELLQKIDNESNRGVAFMGDTLHQLRKYKHHFYHKQIKENKLAYTICLILYYSNRYLITPETREYLLSKYNHITGGYGPEMVRKLMGGKRHAEGIDTQITPEEILSFSPRVMEEEITFALGEVITPLIAMGDNIKNKKIIKQLTLLELSNLVKDSPYKDLPKTDRKPLFSTLDNSRPIGDEAYKTWSGFQVYDVDIKDTEVAKQAKERIIHEFCVYPWFVGVALSTSGSGLHIYTAVRLPGNYSELSLEKQKKIYNFNYFQKFIIFDDFLKEQFEKDFPIGGEINREKYPTLHSLDTWMDNAMSKPQQGIFLTYDPEAFFNPNFVLVDWDSAILGPDKTYGWLYTNLGRERMFKDSHKNYQKIVKSSLQAPEVPLTLDKVSSESFKKILEIAKNYPQNHYKYKDRFHLVNTLSATFSDEEVMMLLKIITTGTPMEEYEAMLKTARNTGKEATSHGLELLATHGIQLGSNATKREVPNYTEEFDKEENVFENITVIEDINHKPNIPSKNEEENEETANSGEILIKGKEGEYLGDYSEVIVETLQNQANESSNIIYLVAPPGSGKTELLKKISKQYKVMALAPLNSIIESKFEVEGFGKIYGTEDTYHDLTEKQREKSSVILSYDKFASNSGRYGVQLFHQDKFDFIFIDESHTITSSKYRPIMSDLIETIQDNRDIKMVMMTGTPTGEDKFIGGICKTIRYQRTDNREKNVEFILVKQKDLLYATIIDDICKHIMAGKKILYPTNLGEAHVSKLRIGIEAGLIKMGRTKPLKIKYYCRANKDIEDVTEINELGKFGEDIDIVFCTSYLGLGVDINDATNNFVVIFDQFETANDIDQWANRLRKSNLDIKIYNYEYYIRDGAWQFKDHSIIVPYGAQPLKTKQNNEYMCESLNSKERLIHQRVYNNVGNDTATKILLKQFPCIEWNGLQEKFVINETRMYLGIFEDQYRLYHLQMGVMGSELKKMGYEVLLTRVHKEDTIIDAIEVEKLFKQSNVKYKDIKAKQISQIINVLNENILMNFQLVYEGRMKLKKSEEGYYIDKPKNTTYAEDIKQFEKILPILMQLSSRYRSTEISELFNCALRKNGTYNFVELQRICNFSMILSQQEAKRLNTPSERFIESTRNLVNSVEEGKITKREYHEFIDKWARWYVDEKSSGVEVNQEPFEIIYKIYEEQFKSLVKLGKFGKTGMASVELRDLSTIKTRWDFYSQANKLFEDLYEHTENTKNIV